MTQNEYDEKRHDLMQAALSGVSVHVFSPEVMQIIKQKHLRPAQVISEIAVDLADTMMRKLYTVEVRK